MKLTHIINKLFLITILSLFLGCSFATDDLEPTDKNQITNVNPLKEITLAVTATAYNSIERQTKKGNIGLAAWGDILIPGERAIAVSRDLIKLGLKHNEEIKIHGLPGTYIVKDKMNKRWKKKIDIYMGLDEAAAFNWGKKKVNITFTKKDGPNLTFTK